MKKYISIKLVAALLATQVGLRATPAYAQNNNGPQILIAYGIAVALMIAAAGSSKNSRAAELVRFDINPQTSSALKAQLGDTQYFSLMNEMAVGSSSAVLSQKYAQSNVAQQVIADYAKATRH